MEFTRWRLYSIWIKGKNGSWFSELRYNKYKKFNPFTTAFDMYWQLNDKPMPVRCTSKTSVKLLISLSYSPVIPYTRVNYRNGWQNFENFTYSLALWLSRKNHPLHVFWSVNMLRSSVQLQPCARSIKCECVDH